MNWLFSNLLAQSDAGEDIAKIVSEMNNGTTTPQSAIERPAELSGNWLSSEYHFPEAASTFTSNIDWLYMFVFWVCVIFFAAIVGVMIYFCIKYRRKGDLIDPQPSSSHNTTLEIAWSVGPSFLLVIIFIVGAQGFFDMRIPRADAEEIQVTASRWNWKFTYPDGDSSAELHLVNKRPTKLVLQSTDVLHSLYIPAFRQKTDVVPGRYTYFYVVPNKQGDYRLSCTEYCGDKHSNMRTLCRVHATAAARKADTQWIEAEYTPWENGERLYKINCSGCHNIEKAGTGPAFGGLWGKTENLVTGTVKVDENYIIRSIEYPDKDIVKGYGPPSKMNSFKGKFTPEQLNYLIAFIKSPAKQPEVESTPAEEDGDGE